MYKLYVAVKWSQSWGDYCWSKNLTSQYKAGAGFLYASDVLKYFQRPEDLVTNACKVCIPMLLGEPYGTVSFFYTKLGNCYLAADRMLWS